MIRSIILVIFVTILTCCGDESPLAFSGKRYKGTAVLHVIEKGAHKSNERGPSLVAGDGVRFNFNFQEVPLPIDSATQKMYGLSDSWSHHLRYSARFSFRVRNDSTVDLFAYLRIDGDIVEHWLGNVSLNEWHYGAVEIEKDFYEYRLDEKVFRFDRPNKSRLGPKYRNFTWYEDGKGGGAPGRVAIMIEEV